MKDQNVRRCISPDITTEYDFPTEESKTSSLINFPPATPGVDYSFIACTNQSKTVDEPEKELIVLAPADITPKKAEEFFLKWISSLWFAPFSLSKQIQSQDLFFKLQYIPFYVVDFGVCTFYEVNVCDKSASMNSNKQNSNETDEPKKIFRKQVGKYSELICASLQPELRKLGDEITDWNPDAAIPGINPVATPEALPFGTAWKCRQVESKVFNKEKEKMVEILEKENYVMIQVVNSNIKYSNFMRSLIYLPVYCYSYSHNNSNYQVLISAQTGTVSGQRPFALGKAVNLLGNLKSWFVSNP